MDEEVAGGRTTFEVLGRCKGVSLPTREIGPVVPLDHPLAALTSLSVCSFDYLTIATAYSTIATFLLSTLHSDLQSTCQIPFCSLTPFFLFIVHNCVPLIR